MRRLVVGALPLLAGALALGAYAQQAGGLTRVQPRSQAQTSQAQTLDAGSWRERLSETDLDLREQAFGELLSQAARSPDLRRQLQTWAREDKGELAWTSRLALRELDGAGADAWTWGGRMPMPHAFGPDPFDVEGFLERFGTPRGIDMEKFFQTPQFQHPGVGTQSSESFQLEMGPDGVKAKITRDVDGESVTEEYEAATLEELLEAHPELRARIGQPGTAFPRWGLQGFGQGPLQLRGLGQRAPQPPLRTDVLGVVVRPLSPEESQTHALPEGEGLFVERVSPGTIASTLGLQHGHVLLELNGRRLHDAEDISAVLTQRKEEEGLELRLHDRWGQERTREWTPERGEEQPRPLNPRRL